MKPIILKKWIEVENEMLGPDKSTKGWSCYLFAFNVSLHKGPKSGKETEHRKRFIYTAEGKTKKEALEEVRKFVEKENTVLLN